MLARRYDIEKEYININNYSPFCNINEVTPKYRRIQFKMPYIEYDNQYIPIHPDTFNDLGLKKSKIVFKRIVYPTSSFRTVYDATANLFLKLPLKRRITRGIRDLPTRQLENVINVKKYLNNLNIKNFNFLDEKPHIFDNPDFNYIIRFIPEKDILPWFYVIKENNLFTENFILKTIKNMIAVWMQLAKEDLLLEAHTQNLLIDKNSNIYYRDLSDIVCYEKKDIIHGYTKFVQSKKELMSLVFDRTFCNQNLNHVFRYVVFKDDKKTKTKIKNIILDEMDKNNISMPNYSLDFRHDTPTHEPIKMPVVWFRSKG